MTPSDVIDAAISTLHDPDSWTKGANARDVFGYLTRCDGEEAASWCLEGILVRHAGPDRALLQLVKEIVRDAVEPERWVRRLNAYKRGRKKPWIPPVNLFDWNDLEYRKHTDVMRVLLEARRMSDSDVYGSAGENEED